MNININVLIFFILAHVLTQDTDLSNIPDISPSTTKVTPSPSNTFTTTNTKTLRPTTTSVPAQRLSPQKKPSIRNATSTMTSQQDQSLQTSVSQKVINDGNLKIRNAPIKAYSSENTTQPDILMIASICGGILLFIMIGTAIIVKRKKEAARREMMSGMKTVYRI
ncbi:hypothetical protein O9G_004388 [Rozella allomycis CSF55]|uniref:Uncharacterized protein n=1 Tax=Rozella allomycis (strain CSF55) TaxID=988480 RepID=A0A075AUP6_ROZAC|nr:hypothetical protein O9G_004388 [Rozella allomycis CSF55]|eukprot:EPZ33983.1 hypothetical protein O9G_004388 [Rozella allomycis CSF55]